MSVLIIALRIKFNQVIEYLKAEVDLLLNKNLSH